MARNKERKLPTTRKRKKRATAITVTPIRILKNKTNANVISVIIVVTTATIKAPTATIKVGATTATTLTTKGAELIHPANVLMVVATTATEHQTIMPAVTIRKVGRLKEMVAKETTTLTDEGRLLCQNGKRKFQKRRLRNERNVTIDLGKK